uniref:MAM domain-containing protein n=1 Tax=Panagrellus redivivus TaxID=6233 RepID=A0A7E4W3F3_PANRE
MLLRSILLCCYLTAVTRGCQPPIAGQYGANSGYYQQPTPYRAYQQPAPVPSYPALANNELPGVYSAGSNVLPSYTNNPPVIKSNSFLQDLTAEEEATFEDTNSVVVPTEPPPDPPVNPFNEITTEKIKISKKDGETDIENENNSAMSEKLASECMRSGIEDVETFMKCVDGGIYGISASHAQFGAEKCDFELEFVCRFYASPHELLTLQVGQFRSPGNRIFEETFAILSHRPVGNYPERSFLFVYAPEGTNPDAAAVLRTDISCQNGDARLSFDYWSSDPYIALKVCTRTEVERSCTQDIMYDEDVSRVEIDVIHPTESKFSVEIVASNFTEGSVLMLDSLDYEAKLCEDAVFMPANAAQTKLTQQIVAHGQQISPASFPIGHETVNEYSRYYPGGNVNANAAYVTAPPMVQPFAPQGQQYVQPPPSILTTTTPVTTKTLSISTVQPPVGATKYIPNSQSLSGIKFVQNKYSQAPSDKKVASHRISNLSIKSLPKDGNCEAVQCDFNRDFCGYGQPAFSASGTRYGKWKISRTPLGPKKNNTHDGFAFVGMDVQSAKVKGRTVYVLESPNFSLDADTLLSFDLYRRSNAITLQVCIDSLMNCPYEAPALNKTVFWRDGESVLLPKTTKKLFFVATQWKRLKWLAIDNIVINKGRGCAGLVAARRSLRI